MATDLERLVVQLSADVKGFERALNRANSTAGSRTRAIENRFNKMQSVVSASFTGVQGAALRAFAVIGGAKGFQVLSDAGTQITNSLKVAGLEGENLERVYNDLKKAAIDNGAPLETLAQLYRGASLAQKELGVTSQDITKFSENIAVALRVSGKSAQETSGALLQLSQALGGSVVRAEEFNSLLEGAPTILLAAANGIKQANGSVSELRKIMLAGNLSSRALFDGIQAGAPVLQALADKTDLTLAQSFTNLQTSMIDVVSEFNTATGASESLASGIGSLARTVDNFDIGGFVKKIQDARQAVEDFLNLIPQIPDIGEILGYQNADGSFINPAFAANQKEIKDLEGAIQDIQDRIEANPALDFDDSPANQRIAELTAKIKELQRQAGLIVPTVDRLGFNEGTGGLQGQTADGRPIDNRPFQGPSPLTFGPQRFGVPESQQVDITDDKYRASAEKDKKARKERLDDYAQEVVRIQQRTDALKLETETQAGLNPLVNDYGYAVEYARTRQELMNAAIEAGRNITPELSAEIDRLAEAYAKGGVAAEQLAESQEKIKDRQKEVLDLQRDVTRGLVDDLIEGKSAADAFAGAIKRIASALLDSAFTNFFNSKSSGGGGGFGGLFSLFGFASGGFTGPGGKYEPAGIVHKGEYVIPKNVVDSIGAGNLEKVFGRGYANGGLVNSSFARPSPTLSGGSSAGITAVYSPVIDATGADAAAVARLERVLANDRATFSSRVEQTVVKARQSNKKGF